MLRPHDLQLAELHACLLAAGGKPSEAWPLIENVIAPRSEKAGRRSANCVAHGSYRAAVSRIEAGDREGATAILDQAVALTRDPALRSPLVELQQVVAQGGEIHFADSATEGDDTVERFNEAISLANAGKLDQALERLTALTKDCSGGELCERAVGMAAELREHIASGLRIKRYNEAVDLANAGKRKEAIEVLRALEPEITDAEWLEQIRVLLRDLGAKTGK